MSLTAHLRELRSRLVKSILAVIAGGIVGLVFYQQIIDAFIGPFKAAAEAQGLTAEINFGAIADPFVIPLKIGLLVGVIVASPVWIYQLWAFVTPGLYRNERKWAAAVVLISVPLFLAGIALCFWLLPRGLMVILGFTPQDVANIVLFSDYLSFVMRLVLVFGIAFLLPVFVVLLECSRSPQRGDAVAYAALDCTRHLRLRGRRDTDGRPDHDDHAGRPDVDPVRGRGSDLPVQRPAAGARSSGRKSTTTSPHRSS